MLQLACLLFGLAAPAAAEDLSRYDAALAAYRDARYADAVAALLETPPPLVAGEYNLLGWAQLQAGRTDEAIAAFSRSVELDPGMNDSFCGLGFAYLRATSFELAVGAFEAAAKGAPPGDECLRGLARAREAAGHPEPESEPAPAEERPPSEYVARGNYFWQRQGDDPFEVFYVKGVNLSFALPGKHITEFPRDAAFYLEWFGLIAEMNANSIRVYTILPPEFYRALRDFNRGREPAQRLRLIQGIWAELPEDDRFADPAYVDAVEREIATAVDVIHGRATIPQRLGHAHGVYRADVSDDVLAFIFGREWEPAAVSGFQRIDTRDAFHGDYLRIDGANPMEAWLTARLDHLIGYEQATFGVQRPVAWMNWPTLDALRHSSEASFDEAAVFRRASGEHVARPPEDEIYDDDAVSVDETKVVPRTAFHAGLFASYHVYPYYPDFMRNDARYANDPAGHYNGYLADLKRHHADMPLLVSEYGVPTSRAVGRFHPEGLDHGGHGEQSHAAALQRMTADIRATGCAGGVVFSWIDEWVKRCWMVAGTEGEDRRWYNAMDPEESYGLLALLPAETAKVRGDPAAWDASTLLSTADDGCLRRLFVDSDAGYVYFRLDLEGEIDWSERAYLLAIDTAGDAQGDHTLPLDLGRHDEVGIEFAVVLHGDRSRVLVDDRYNRTRFSPLLAKLPGRSGWEFHDGYRLEANDDGVFEELKIPHGRKFGRDGTVYPERIYDAGMLVQGNLDDDSTADWLYTPQAAMLELRIPWGLLNFSDPSQREVLEDKVQRRVTPGLRIAVYAYRPRSLEDSRLRVPAKPERLPADPAAMVSYTWETWDDPEHVGHLKAAYYAMQSAFHDLQAPAAAWTIPSQFDFASVIGNHYASIDEYFALPAVRHAAVAAAGDLYGRAMANLAFGVVQGRRFYLLEARYLLETLLVETEDPRRTEAARVALGYLGAILAGGIPGAEGDADPPQRIGIRAHKTTASGIRSITLGRSAIHLHDGARVRTQVDRVTRDWLSGFNFSSAPEKFDAAHVVPWHEGLRTLDLVHFAAARVEPVWGTRVRRFGERWYAPDAEGAFRFEVTADKVYGYPTNLFIDDHNVWINDTHGISALAWDATDADLVVGCGDHPGKADAAYDLAARGVNVYMPTDRYLYTLIGTVTPGMLLGSAPIRDSEDGAILGDQPVTFGIDEPIVVSYTTQHYPLQYYDTPYRYFTALADYAGVPLAITAVDVPEYGKVAVVVDAAREIGAALIGVRVATLEEHDAVAAWLREDRARRAILFHSAVYPDGYRLFAEFPQQTSFGDIHPEFAR